MQITVQHCFIKSNLLYPETESKVRTCFDILYFPGRCEPLDHLQTYMNQYYFSVDSLRILFLPMLGLFETLPLKSTYFRRYLS